jgi:hypothetical protein
MFRNKTLWHAIGSMYVAVGLGVLAKRHIEAAYWAHREVIADEIEKSIERRKAA